MKSRPNTLATTEQLPPSLTEAVDRFRQAWRGGTPPDLSVYVPRDAPPQERRQILAALVAVDLESRYQPGRNGPDCGDSAAPNTLLESYLKLFPELGPSTQLPIELIADEYRVRHLWGDRPPHGEYQRRFPELGEQLDEALKRVDTELQNKGVAETVDLDATTDGAPAGNADYPAGSAQAGGVANDADLPSDAARPTLPISEHFLFGVKLGEGGMGAVYAATDQLLGREVAIKVVRRKWHADKQMLDRFFREAQLASHLQHPGICPVYEVGLIQPPDGQVDERVPFIAMKKVEGQTLTEALQERGDDLVVSRSRWLEVLGEIADAVSYAHDRGVIHRDLKPANVMLGVHGETQVMDWGLAKFSFDLPDSEREAAGEEFDATQYGTVKGTWAYMPPEQATGKTDQIDARADVFALGSVLCQILTGKPAYAGPSATVIAAAQAGDLQDAKQRLTKSNADRELIQLTLRCLAPNPNDRFPNATHVARGIASYQASVEERLQAAEVEAEKERGRRLAAAERLRTARWRLGLAATILIFFTFAATASWLYVQSALTSAAAQQTYAAQLDAQASLLRDAAITESWNDVAWNRYVENRRFAAAAHREAENRIGWLISVPGLAAWTGHSDTREHTIQAERDFAAAERDRDLCLALREARLAGTAVQFGVFDWLKELQNSQEALATYGVELDRVEKSADIIRASAIRNQLIGALDQLLKTCVAVGENDLLPRIADVEALLREVDPDPLRQRLRSIVTSSQSSLANRENAIATLVDDWDFSVHPLETSIVLCQSLGNSDRMQAIRSLRRLLELDPRMLEVHMTLGHFYSVLEPPQPYAAMAHWQAAAVLAPESPGTFLNLGNVLSELNRLDDAAGCFRRAIELQPDYSEAHLNLGSALRELGQYDLAEVHYRKAIELRPESVLTHRGLAAMLMEDGRLEEAEQRFRDAIDLAPDYIPNHHNLALVLEQQARLEAAEGSFLRALELCESDDGRLSKYLSGILDRDQLDLARAHAAVSHDYGILLYRQQRFAEAEPRIRRAIELKPDMAPAHRSLADLLAATGRSDQAEASFRESLRLDPDDAATHVNLANLISGKQSFVEAEQLFRAAIQLREDLPEAHLGLGAVLFYQGQLDEAEQSSRRAIELQGDSLQAVSNLGAVLFAKGQHSEAEKYLRQAIALDPTYRSGYHNLNLLLRRQGRFADAEALLRAGLEHLENDPTLLCFLGRVLGPQGKLAEAVESLRRGDMLGRRQPTWSIPSQKWLADAEANLATDQRLREVLESDIEVTDPDELVRLAAHCQQPYKQRYRQSVVFYKKAFAAKPELAKISPQTHHRYNAACAAVLSTTQADDDGNPPGENEKTAWRDRARRWLESDLEALSALQEPPAARAAAERSLKHWLSDPDLRPVRDAAELDKLPTAEKKAWQQLWNDVRSMLNRAADLSNNQAGGRRGQPHLAPREEDGGYAPPSRASTIGWSAQVAGRQVRR